MKHKSHFQTKQLSSGQHGKFVWTTWTRCKICVGKFLLNLLDFAPENSPINRKSDHTTRISHIQMYFIRLEKLFLFLLK